MSLMLSFPTLEVPCGVCRGPLNPLFVNTSRPSPSPARHALFGDAVSERPLAPSFCELDAGGQGV